MTAITAMTAAVPLCGAPTPRLPFASVTDRLDLSC